MATIAAIGTSEARSHEELAADLQRVEERLEAGYRKIELTAASREDIAQWETLWLRLLDDYEHIYDKLVA